MVVRINNNLWRIQFTYPQNPNLRMSDGRQVLGLFDLTILDKILSETLKRAYIA